VPGLVAWQFFESSNRAPAGGQRDGRVVAGDTHRH
jgi:hypothetical protein